MTALQQSRQIFIDETERKPNLYASRVMSGVVAVLAIVWAFNETGVFTLEKGLMRICLVAALGQHWVMQFVARKPEWIVRPQVKYVFMAIILTLVLILTTLMNIHAVLAYVLPLLLAMQYRSYRMSCIALVGACVACAVAPMLSYWLGTWNLNFMTGYVQTFCRVTVTTTPGNGISTRDALWQIALYWALPQALTLAAFGLILFSVTRSGVDSVHNQMQVVDLSNDLARRLHSIHSLQERVLYSLSDIIENRDTDTGGHVRRTSEVVRLLTHAMRDDPASGVTDGFCAAVVKCAPMHDLGKIAIPDTILKKPGRLTPEEYAVVKLHPVQSADIIVRALTGIEDETLVTVATNIAKYHHERVDGGGYPEGLRGRAIPLEARIMAIADVYDALVSKRCYKAAMTFDEAFETIESCMGTQFDAGLNGYFVACRPAIEAFYAQTNLTEM